MRRAFLCGQDSLSGKSFEHRREWVEERLFELSEIFAVGLYAYAVMSNHLHVVLYADPLLPSRWSDEEVAERWVRLLPARVGGEVDEDACTAKREAVLNDPARIRELRARLGSVSWFMRCLSEPIARWANREDDCTGRFWEGRFKCQVLLDEAAVTACMAYVDLNPVRAGIAADLPDLDPTSIKQRLESVADACEEENHWDAEILRPIAGVAPLDVLPFTLHDYIDLVDWTGRQVRNDKRGAIDASTPAMLNRLGIQHHHWKAQVLGIESHYWRAVGAVDALIDKAAAIGQRWLKGCGRRREQAGNPAF